MGPNVINTNNDIPSNERPNNDSRNSGDDSQHSIENNFQFNCCANSDKTTAIICVRFSSIINFLKALIVYLYLLQLIISIIIVMGIGFWSFSDKTTPFFGSIEDMDMDMCLDSG